MKKISVSRDLNNFTYSIRGRIRFNSTGSRARTRNDRKNKSHVYLRNQSLEDSFRCCSKPTAKSWRLSSLVSFFLFQAPVPSIPAPQNIAGSAKNANFHRTAQSRCAYACESAHGGIDLFARATVRSMQIIASFTEPPAIPVRRWPKAD